MDRMDIEAVKGLYHPDAEEHHGPFHGFAEELFVLQLESLPGKIERIRHSIGVSVHVPDAAAV